MKKVVQIRENSPVPDNAVYLYSKEIKDHANRKLVDIDYDHGWFSTDVTYKYLTPLVTVHYYEVPSDTEI